jgi:hypothetical protein
VSQRAWRISTLLGVLFLVALTPRWVARDTYVTADEDNWMRRAGGFAWGLANGRPGRTYQNGHPGVLTMELAILGQGPGGAERFADPVTGNPRVVTAVPGFFEGLVEARRAFALATAIGVVAVAGLAWRLLGAGPAVLGGLALALDPFYLAHSQLVHLDALLTACMTLATLCAALRWIGGGGRGWVLAGGACSGLALLAKVPAVYLALFVPFAAVLFGALAGRRAGAKTLLTDLALWGFAGLVVFVALWPSMWVQPTSTLTRMAEFARETGGQPHEQGSFFLGSPVVDPGPLFYLVSTPLRLSPLAMLGLVALAALLLRRRPALQTRERRAAALLAFFAAGFLLFMTLGAKKFDRYVLPIYPALDLLAGLGLWLGWRALVEGPLKWRPSAWSVAAPTAALGMAFLAAAPAVAVFPHYLAYYNPLLGGGAGAARLIPVGEGEGLREAAAWLNAQPDAANLYVASDSFETLKASFVGGGETLRDRVPGGASFVVLYLYQTQIGHSPRVVSEYAGRQPAHVVTLRGIEYARIYRVERSAAGVGGSDGEGLWCAKTLRREWRAGRPPHRSSRPDEFGGSWCWPARRCCWWRSRPAGWGGTCSSPRTKIAGCGGPVALPTE